MQSRLVALGLALTPDELDLITAEVKVLADKKKFVYDDDLLILAKRAPERGTRLVRYQALSGNTILPTATVEIEMDGQVRTASAVETAPWMRRSRPRTLRWG